MKTYSAYLTLVLPVLILSSCTSSVYRQVYPTLLDGKYDSEFPYKGCSEQLEEISQSVKRLTVMAHYKSYAFPLVDSVTLPDITPQSLSARQERLGFQHHTTAGTATVIYNEDGKLALLTCAHVVSHRDTAISYHRGEDGAATPFVRSFAVKTSQLNFLNEVAGGTALEILALDRQSDIAILGQKLTPQQTVGVRVFTYPFGKARELEWGTFVYLFGYPSGYKMITKGIVSIPTKTGSGSFLVDAVVSPGSSGAIALAIRDGIPNFELVGLVKMIPAEASFVLSPSIREWNVDYDPYEPYRGDIFIERKMEIQYGIAQAIPAEAVLEFIQKSQDQLAAKGYQLRPLVRPPEAEKRSM